MSVILQSLHASLAQGALQETTPRRSSTAATTLFTQRKVTDTVRYRRQSDGTLDTVTWGLNRGTVLFNSTRNWNTLELATLSRAQVINCRETWPSCSSPAQTPSRTGSTTSPKHPRWPQAYPGHKGAAFDEPFDFIGYLGSESGRWVCRRMMGLRVGDGRAPESAMPSTFCTTAESTPPDAKANDHSEAGGKPTVQRFHTHQASAPIKATRQQLSQIITLCARDA